MAKRPDRRALIRGLVVALDGLALWFLAVVLTAYFTPNALPWASAPAIGEALLTFTAFWAYSPGVSVVEVASYVGIALMVLGPTWYWVLKPLTADLEVEFPGVRMPPRFRRD